ncbi:MAG TPA: hypothetical protein VKA68_06335 [bacterium]|nr:hypothetical protein [bacterium]
MANIFAANKSNVSVTVEGQEPKNIEGLQSITYKSYQDREDVPAIGTDERIDVVFGLKYVKGTLKVKSTDSLLNDILSNGTPFQLGVNLKSGVEGTVQRVTFDQCYLDDKEFGINTNGVGITTYYFNATVVREELSSGAQQQQG